MKGEFFDKSVYASISKHISNLDKFSEPVQMRLLDIFHQYQYMKILESLYFLPVYNLQTTRKTILFVAARPKITPPKPEEDTESDTEYRKISEVLSKSQNHEYQIIPILSARYIDLQEGLLRYRPVIIHFSGHGTKLGEICLEGDDGELVNVTFDVLADLLSKFSCIECVVLNACYTHTQMKPSALKNIKCLIGAKNQISSSAAIDFAESFYQALFYGQNYETAFDMAKNRLMVESRIDADAFVIFSFTGVSHVKEDQPQ